MDVEILAPQVHLLVKVVEHADTSRAKLVSNLVHVIAILSCEGEVDIIAIVVKCLSSLSHRTPRDADRLTSPLTCRRPPVAVQYKQIHKRAAVKCSGSDRQRLSLHHEVVQAAQSLPPFRSARCATDPSLAAIQAKSLRTSPTPAPVVTRYQASRRASPG